MRFSVFHKLDKAINRNSLLIHYLFLPVMLIDILDVHILVLLFLEADTVTALSLPLVYMVCWYQCRRGSI